MSDQTHRSTRVALQSNLDEWSTDLHDTPQRVKPNLLTHAGVGITSDGGPTNVFLQRERGWSCYKSELNIILAYEQLTEICAG